ncbi:hypothetical protein IE989_30660 [Klebsiella pneumoniae]|nr:hypothetical protein [Klebsiella pneumoniae]
MCSSSTLARCCGQRCRWLSSTLAGKVGRWLVLYPQRWRVTGRRRCSSSTLALGKRILAGAHLQRWRVNRALR